MRNCPYRLIHAQTLSVLVTTVKREIFPHSRAAAPRAERTPWAASGGRVPPRHRQTGGGAARRPPDAVGDPRRLPLPSGGPSRGVRAPRRQRQAATEGGVVCLKRMPKGVYSASNSCRSDATCHRQGPQHRSGFFMRQHEQGARSREAGSPPLRGSSPPHASPPPH